MNTSEAPLCCQGTPSSRSRLVGYVPTWLRGSRGIALGAVAVVGVGMLSGWPWLVAIGAAPVLLAFLPCAVMCALGLCMMGKGNQPAVPSAQVGDGTTGTITGTAAPALLTSQVETAPMIEPLAARESVTIS